MDASPPLALPLALALLLALVLLPAGAYAQPAHSLAAVQSDTLTITGLTAPVEILRDRWGIAHIYAENEADLFFAQGYSAARDRLFQFEIWRRQATGTVAELLGPREVQRDVGTRLFQFRGDLIAEMNHYHPRGAAIIPAFVRGVNAYIDRTHADPSLLPVEFELLGMVPQHWTPEVVISRHQGLLGNIGRELDLGRAVHRLGAGPVKALVPFGPGDPMIDLDIRLDTQVLFEDVLAPYNAFRQPIRFQPEDLAAAYRNDAAHYERLAAALDQEAVHYADDDRRDIGSNNWVVAGRRTQSGYPMMANDPHRAHAVPSLRYWVHLVAPGWNVIGGGEPEIPGVSIGHNEHGAWGLTVFQTDGEDLYVYETNPDDPNAYRYRGGWAAMTIITDTIQVRGQAPVVVQHRYTRHGPVVFQDTTRHRAAAVRAAWMEIGGAPYLASLRMDQADSWDAFREACAYSHIPGENMVWAGRDGVIGWQSVGLAPVRPNWNGLVPVPGDGRYEWDGYLPMLDKPHVVDPDQGFWATANNMLVPEGYPHRNAVGWEWSDAFRAQRIAEALAAGHTHTLADMAALQTDYLSLPARALVPLLADVPTPDVRVAAARAALLAWDYRLAPHSVAAGLYVAWERALSAAVYQRLVPEAARPHLRRLPMQTVVDVLTRPGHPLARSSSLAQTDVLQQALEAAVADLTERLGPDMRRWQYGQPAYKHVTIRHPLSAAAIDSLRARLDVGPLPRGGNSYTVNNTAWGDNQTSGASFRLIVDTADWDRAVGMNAPGQSGSPDDRYYRNLFDAWALDQFFPVYYSRPLVESVTERIDLLRPGR